jgi:glycosyltransferase involved in cell wall biosynthesis
VGVSRHTLEKHLAQGYFREAGTRRVIYNALPESPATPPSAGRQHGQPLRLGYVGQLIPSKGISELLSLMNTWPSSVCTLTVAGKGAADYEQALRRTAPANVRFLGFVNPAEVYQEIDVLVVPSLWEEPLGMIVLEAYMHGVPVIAANRGGLAEIVDQDRTGMLYDPASPSGLKDAVAAFLRDPSLIARCRPGIAERARYFVLDRMRAEYLDVLEDARAVRAESSSASARRAVT